MSITNLPSDIREAYRKFMFHLLPTDIKGEIKKAYQNDLIRRCAKCGKLANCCFGTISLCDKCFEAFKLWLGEKHEEKPITQNKKNPTVFFEED